MLEIFDLQLTTWEIHIGFKGQAYFAIIAHHQAPPGDIISMQTGFAQE